MPALAAGSNAPEVSLPLLGSSEKFSLTAALKKGPVLLAFFKVSCPVCQLSFPYFQRLAAAYGHKIAIIGVSQDAAAETAAFAREYGVKFPIALDDPKGYPVSNAYGLTNVPTLFWISRDGQVEITSVGWSKQDVGHVNLQLASASQMPLAQVFRPGESVVEFKPG